MRCNKHNLWRRSKEESEGKKRFTGKGHGETSSNNDLKSTSLYSDSRKSRSFEIHDFNGDAASSKKAFHDPEIKMGMFPKHLENNYSAHRRKEHRAVVEGEEPRGPTRIESPKGQVRGQSRRIFKGINKREAGP